ncbi:MAG: hypothetical protein ACLUS6_00710 [Dysosmobacter sp.]
MWGSPGRSDYVRRQHISGHGTKRTVTGAPLTVMACRNFNRLGKLPEMPHRPCSSCFTG